MGKETTEKGGAEPQDTDFEKSALDILDGMEGGKPAEIVKKEEEDPKKEKAPGEDPKKSEDGAGKNEDPKLKAEDDLKVPRSRLNREIEKKNSIQTKYDKMVEKVKAEEDRLNGLSDDDKEEQANLKKLGMDTKLSKLKDKLEDMKDDISDKDTEIKGLKETISKSETKSLSKRISELTEKMDGKDGLPKFDIKELIEFGKSENYMPTDPLKLYNFKYQAEIYAKKFEKEGTNMDKGGKGKHTPTKKILNFDDGNEDFNSEAEAILKGVGQTS